MKEKKSILAVALYSVFTAIMFFISMNTTNDSGLLMMVPVFPWALIGVLFEQASAIIFLGYLPFYIINAAIIYKFTSKNPLFSLKSQALTVALSMIPWTSMVFYEAATCTEKLCGLIAITAAIPGFFLVSLLGSDTNSLGAYTLVLILNVIIYFLLVWGVTSLFRRLAAKKRLK